MVTEKLKKEFGEIELLVIAAMKEIQRTCLSTSGNDV